MPERVRVQKVFNDVRAHRRVADLIRRFSTNRRDIRRVAAEDLDLRACRSILDLGCAFGSFATSLQGRVHPRAAITGVDVVEAYEPMFLDACRRAGMAGRFFSGGASVLKTFADRTFDLILCSYALYFFPEAIEDIARLLRRDGIFIAITHHQRNAGELIDLTKDILRAEGIFHETTLPFETIIGRFSSENGEALLNPWFGQIRSIDYINSLVFPPTEALRLLEYFRFKSPLYFMGTGMDSEDMLSRIRDRLAGMASGQNSLTVSKDDRIFVCTLPKHGERTMKKGRRRYCHSCGGPVSHRTEDGIRRDFCPVCNLFFYENPLPVVSTIVDVDRRILLVKRGKKPYRGSWCLPTGFAEAGESIEAAALRELEEETGIAGRILSLVDVRSYRSRFYGDLLFITFEVEPLGGSLQPRPGSDTVAARYFPLEHLPAIAFSSSRNALQRYIAGKAEYWAIVDSFSLSVRKEETGGVRQNLLSDRMIGVIEENAESIARRWMKDALSNPSTADFRKYDEARLFGDVRKILSQFASWLGGFYRDADIRNYYTTFGRSSRRDGVALSHALSALSLIKKHLWEFALSQGMWRKTLDIYMTLELDRRIVIFFDRAVFYTTQGYEA